jgi:hypothetical protein
MTKTPPTNENTLAPILAILIAVGLGFLASATYLMPSLAEVIQRLTSG